MHVNLAEAEAQLPHLIRAALAGEEVIIADLGRASVQLVPVRPVSGPRRPGAWSDLPPPADDWDSPGFNDVIARALLGESE